MVAPASPCSVERRRIIGRALYPAYRSCWDVIRCAGNNRLCRRAKIDECDPGPVRTGRPGHSYWLPSDGEVMCAFALMASRSSKIQVPAGVNGGKACRIAINENFNGRSVVPRSVGVESRPWRRPPQYSPVRSRHHLHCRDGRDGGRPLSEAENLRSRAAVIPRAIDSAITVSVRHRLFAPDRA